MKITGTMTSGSKHNPLVHSLHITSCAINKSLQFLRTCYETCISFSHSRSAIIITGAFLGLLLLIYYCSQPYSVITKRQHFMLLALVIPQIMQFAATTFLRKLTKKFFCLVHNEPLTHIISRDLVLGLF